MQVFLTTAFTNFNTFKRILMVLTRTALICVGGHFLNMADVSPFAHFSSSAAYLKISDVGNDALKLPVKRPDWAV